MKPELLARIEALEKGRDTDWLAYTHEKPDGAGGLVLLSDRVSWGCGEPVEVGRVPRHKVMEHRRSTIRIQSRQGAGG